VVALFELQTRLVGGHALQSDAAGLIIPRVPADHRVRVPDLGFHVVDQLERGAFPAERHLVDDPTEPPVVIRIPWPQDVDAFDHRRVARPVVVVLEERPQPPGRVRQVERVPVFAHRIVLPWW